MKFESPSSVVVVGCKCWICINGSASYRRETSRAFPDRFLRARQHLEPGPPPQSIVTGHYTHYYLRSATQRGAVYDCLVALRCTRLSSNPPIYLPFVTCVVFLFEDVTNNIQRVSMRHKASLSSSPSPHRTRCMHNSTQLCCCGRCLHVGYTVSAHPAADRRRRRLQFYSSH